MSKISFLKEYLFMTVFLWVFYTIGLSPFALFIWKLSVTQYYLWLITGLPANLILNYPIGKGLTKTLNRFFK